MAIDSDDNGYITVMLLANWYWRFLMVVIVVKNNHQSGFSDHLPELG